MIAGTRIRRVGVAAAAALLLVLLASPRSHAQTQSSSPAVGERSKLRILYVGRPGSDREKDFVGFLKKYFDVVQTGNLQAFKETDTQGFDVTLLDWDKHFNVRKFPLSLSRNFSRPVMTFGTRGGFMCQEWGLKTGYL